MHEKLEELHPLIRELADAFGRRQGLSREEREDLGQDVCLKLLADEGAKLRQYRGESSFKGYLRVLVINTARDRQRHEYGKHRPAARSRELGPWACRYERLRRIEGRSQQECLAILEREGFMVLPGEIETLEAELAARPRPRRFESAENLAEMPSGELDPEQETLAHERKGQRREVRLALRLAVRELPPPDFLLLRLYCEPEATARAKQLSRLLGIPPTEVYRRYKHLYQHLGRRLQHLGVDDRQVVELLQEWRDDGENALADPSDPIAGRDK